MRNITFKEKTYSINALTRGQIKAIKEKGKFGISSVSIQGVTGIEWDDFINALVGAYLPDEAQEFYGHLDEASRKERKAVELELIAETWGAETEEKN